MNTYENNKDLMEEIIYVCSNSNCIKEAYFKLSKNINYNTFIKYAKVLGCYTKKESYVNEEIQLEDILSNKKFCDSYKLSKKLIKAGLKEYKCEKCYLTCWRGEKISLELHHKDGNRRNNNLDNLQLLCPNCHALTDNYRAKNIKGGNNI